MEDVILEVTASIIKKQIDNVSSRLVGDVKSFWMKHVSSFKEYVGNANKRYETTKTLLYKDQAVPLRDIYVDTSLKRGKTLIDEAEFVKQLLQGNRCLVSATAGAGKSFFAKSIFLKILSSEQAIPLLIELRNLNGTDLGIIDYLVQDLKSNFKISITRDVMIGLIEQGKFTLILDGYDELTSERTLAVNADLQSLEIPFAESAILITSRPGGDHLEFLSGFTNYKVQPLQLSHAMTLVEKLKYDQVVKDSFLKDLEAQLFEQHIDFLSNPLLLTIMLMTYGDLAEIPSKMHIFYEQAFDTLFYRHDSSKGMYRREVKCQLAIDDFRDILSCISASSYIRGQITLTNTDLLAFIRKAKQTTNITKLNPREYTDDLVQSVCLFLQDGMRYTYNHRSFQEYFAALFLIQIPTDQKLNVYRRYLVREETDSALKLAFEMNQVMVEREFIKPMLELILADNHTAEDLLRSHMKAIRLERKMVRRRVNGKIKKELDRHSYLLDDATEFWNFQTFVERMYKSKAKNYLKFGVMTKKAFIEEYGTGEVSEVIAIDDIQQPEFHDKLKRLGIIDIAGRRLDFLHWIKIEIEKHDQRTGDFELETWL